MALEFLEERTEGFSPVIPVRLEDSTIPDRLQKLNWVDLLAEGGMKKLQLVLKGATSKKRPNIAST